MNVYVSMIFRKLGSNFSISLGFDRHFYARKQVFRLVLTVYIWLIFNYSFLKSLAGIFLHVCSSSIRITLTPYLNYGALHFTFSTGAVREFYTVEKAVIRTTIGIKLNNSAKQIRAKEGGHTLDGGAGGAETKAITAAKTGSPGQDNRADSHDLQSVDVND